MYTFLKLYKRKVKEIDVTNCQPLLLSSIVDSTYYKKDVESGIFYDKISAFINIDRSSFKQYSYKYIFFSNKHSKSGKIYEALEYHYPGLIKQINLLKDKENLALQLQKLESDIFVNKIGSMDIRMLLRHDSILVHEEEEETIKQLIRIQFKKIGAKVTIKNK